MDVFTERRELKVEPDEFIAWYNDGCHSLVRPIRCTGTDHRHHQQATAHPRVSTRHKAQNQGGSASARVRRRHVDRLRHVRTYPTVTGRMGSRALPSPQRRSSQLGNEHG
ncbi:unnamed protein product [Sphagnum jensenii]